MQESDDGLILGPSARSLAPSAFAQEASHSAMEKLSTDPQERPCGGALE